MNLSLLYYTITNLRFTQIYYQILYRSYSFHFRLKKTQNKAVRLNYNEWTPKSKTLFIYDKFSFINISDHFRHWNELKHGNLWTYNLNYMDWLLQPGMDFESGAKWIDIFIDDISDNKLGLDPYPTALRCINWIKFITIHVENIPKHQLDNWNSALYNQYKLLQKRLEYHLLGNHLLEDALSLYIGSLYFKNNSFYAKATALMKQQLKEQILKDGAHFEQSPMYHCILLDRLLDCYNLSINNLLFKWQSEFTNELEKYCVKMLGHLESIIYSDGTIPLLNDSAYNIAPSPKDIFNYAKRLNLHWDPISLYDCGYRRFTNGSLEGIIDIGDIKASYQPGHSHADTFNYELRINGEPFIIDTGISTYEKNDRRQYERSTLAHNTVSIDSKNSSEVWSGFRVGRRAQVKILIDTENHWKASHNGFGKQCLHIREYIIDAYFHIHDKIPEGSKGISYIHFAASVSNVKVQKNVIITNLATIEVWGADKIELADDMASVIYNVFQPIIVAKLYFTKELSYSIKAYNENSLSN